MEIEAGIDSGWHFWGGRWGCDKFAEKRKKRDKTWEKKSKKFEVEGKSK